MYSTPSSSSLFPRRATANWSRVVVVGMECPTRASGGFYRRFKCMCVLCLLQYAVRVLFASNQLRLNAVFLDDDRRIRPFHYQRQGQLGKEMPESMTLGSTLVYRGCLARTYTAVFFISMETPCFVAPWYCRLTNESPRVFARAYIQVRLLGSRVRRHQRHSGVLRTYVRPELSPIFSVRATNESVTV